MMVTHFQRPLVRRAVPGLLVLGLVGSPGCAPPEPPPFDAARAMDHVRTQVDFGPRVPGTRAHRRCAGWLSETLNQTSARVAVQTFYYFPPRPDTVRSRDSVTLWNIIASFKPESTERIMLCAHWDSRPWADEDPDSSRHREPIDGANDGASGVAVLLEMARIMGHVPPPFGVDIALFDGEDQGRSGHPEEYLIGSKAYVQRAPNYHPLAVILLDMVGDRDLSLPREAYSDTLAPDLTDLVWQTALELQLPAFVDTTGRPVIDDHLPFLLNGIAAVDIIDFEYPYWHTVEDTPDKLSVESLEQIGLLMRQLVYGTPLERFRAASRVVRAAARDPHG